MESSRIDADSKRYADGPMANENFRNEVSKRVQLNALNANATWFHATRPGPANTNPLLHERHYVEILSATDKSRYTIVFNRFILFDHCWQSTALKCYFFDIFTIQWNWGNFSWNEKDGRKKPGSGDASVVKKNLEQLGGTEKQKFVLWKSSHVAKIDLCLQCFNTTHRNNIYSQQVL